MCFSDATIEALDGVFIILSFLVWEPKDERSDVVLKVNLFDFYDYGV